MKVSKGTRPTASKVREALFNILGDKVVEAKFLDLYAGTGVVGFEAIKRGALSSVFVDINASGIRTIKKLSDEKGLEKVIHAIKSRAYNALRLFIKNKKKYDIIFIDPPYNSDEIDTVLPLIGEGDIVKANSYIIVEHYYKRKLSEIIGCLKLKKSYRYGDTVLSVYEIKLSNDEHKLVRGQITKDKGQRTKD